MFASLCLYPSFGIAPGAGLTCYWPKRLSLALNLSLSESLILVFTLDLCLGPSEERPSNLFPAPLSLVRGMALARLKLRESGSCSPRLGVPSGLNHWYVTMVTALRQDER